MASHPHPKALYWLMASYAFFMMSFGSLIALLVLYEITILQLSPDKAYSIFSAAMALIWILPLIGGYLSGKWGYANGAYVGLIFCACGFFVLAIQNLQMLYIGLALFVVGNAFTTPATWCMVDHCYSKTSLMRESGFTLFYLFFNLGGVVGIFLAGYIAETWGFSFSFNLSAISLLIAFFLLYLGKHKIIVHKERTIAPQVRWPNYLIILSLIGVCICGTPISMLLFENVSVNNAIMLFALLFMIFVLIRIALKQEKPIAKNKVFAFLFLSLISICFWTLYSLEPSFLSVFIKHNVDKNFLGISIPASSFFAFDGIFVIIIGLILSRIWMYLSAKKLNPALSVKFASSLIVIGLGFCLLALITYVKGDLQTPAGYIVFAYAIFAFAELLVSPLGISMVGALAPEGKEGIMMGFWQLCSGIGGIFAGYIAIFADFPKRPLPLSVSNLMYSKVFFLVGIGSVIVGIIVWIFAKKLKRLMPEHPYDMPQI